MLHHLPGFARVLPPWPSPASFLRLTMAGAPTLLFYNPQDENFLCYNDILSMSPCHLNCIPTTNHIPDWRYLLLAPTRSLVSGQCTCSRAGRSLLPSRSHSCGKYWVALSGVARSSGVSLG